MKNKLVIIPLILSMLLIACGSSEHTTVFEDAIEEITEIDELESDAKEDTEEKSREIFSKDYTFGTDGTYNVTWLEKSDGTISISHTIRASSKDELALMSALGSSHLIEKYKDNDNVYFMLYASVNDSDLHYSLDSSFGFVSVEENGDVVNELPQWVKSIADNDSENPLYNDLDIFQSILDTMNDITDYENTMIQLY